MCIFSNCYAATCPVPTGTVITSKNADYARARLNSNYYTSKNKFPSLIIYCNTTQDVQNAINYARCQKLPVRVRSGGHNHESYSTGTGVVVIDVSKMKQININKAKQIATVQPGMNGGELYRTLYNNGLTQVGGTCSGVGISGLILSGGMGPLARTQGMACDSLLAIDIVDANGALHHVTKNNDSDLFWASCGGGGNNFGVVTSIQLKVYPVTAVAWFNIGWDWNQPIDQIITEWQKFFLNNDKRWYSHLDLWSKPFPAKKFHQQPIKVIGIFWGTPEEATRELRPFLKLGKPTTQIIKTVDWQTAVKQFEDAVKVYISSKPEYKSSGAYVMDNLPPKAIQTITTTLHDTHSPLLNVLFFSLGGATSDRGSNETAYFYRPAKAFAVYSTQWLKPMDDVKYIQELDNLRNNLLPFTRGDYVGNPDRKIQNYLTAYYGDNVQRLRCIKRKYDPNDLFHFEQGIPPAGINSHC